MYIYVANTGKHGGRYTIDLRYFQEIQILNIPLLPWKFTVKELFLLKEGGLEPPISLAAARHHTDKAIWTLKANLSILLQLLT